jgi:hypothetical protein
MDGIEAFDSLDELIGCIITTSLNQTKDQVILVDVSPISRIAL